jgi:outer membrane protein
MMRLRLTTCIALLLAVSVRAVAQQSAVLRLTLRQAVDLSLKQNPEVETAALNFAESQQDRNIARAGLLPQADVRVSEQAERENLAALFGRPFPGFSEHIGPFAIFQAGPSFSVPVFDLTLYRRLQEASHETRASGHDIQNVREETALMVVSQYLGGLQAAANVSAVQSQVELAQALYDQASDLQKHGAGTGLDTLRAEVELQNQQQRLIEAQAQYKTSLFGLSRLLNLDPNQPVELADQLSFFQTPEFQGDTTLQQAYAQRPEMLALDERMKETELARKQARDQRLPSLGVSGNWGYTGLGIESAIPTYTYAATVDVPLITGGRIRAQIAKSDLELKKIAEARDDLRNRIALEVKTAVVELDAARHEVDVANQGVKLAEEEVTQARDRFAAGVANNIEVVTAQDSLERAHNNQIAALYNYNQSRADLAHATGHTEDLYAK